MIFTIKKATLLCCLVYLEQVKLIKCRGDTGVNSGRNDKGPLGGWDDEVMNPWPGYEDQNQWKLEDSIPGVPGRSYPNYDKIPETSFDCTKQKDPGYYADPEARCQVFHICQAGGRQNSFLCPVGTIFNQQTFVCDWWFNVDCAEALMYYEYNANLYRGPNVGLEGVKGDRRSSSGSQGASHQPPVATPKWDSQDQTNRGQSGNRAPSGMNWPNQGPDNWLNRGRSGQMGVTGGQNQGGGGKGYSGGATGWERQRPMQNQGGSQKGQTGGQFGGIVNRGQQGVLNNQFENQGHLSGNSKGQRESGNQGQHGIGNQGQHGIGNQGQRVIGNKGQRGIGNQGLRGIGNQGQRGIGNQGQRGIGNQGQRGIGNQGQHGIGNNKGQQGFVNSQAQQENWNTQGNMNRQKGHEVINSNQVFGTNIGSGNQRSPDGNHGWKGDSNQQWNQHGQGSQGWNPQGMNIQSNQGQHGSNQRWEGNANQGQLGGYPITNNQNWRHNSDGNQGYTGNNFGGENRQGQDFTVNQGGFGGNSGFMNQGNTKGQGWTDHIQRGGNFEQQFHPNSNQNQRRNQAQGGGQKGAEIGGQGQHSVGNAGQHWGKGVTSGNIVGEKDINIQQGLNPGSGDVVWEQGMRDGNLGRQKGGNQIAGVNQGQSGVVWPPQGQNVGSSGPRWNQKGSTPQHPGAAQGPNTNHRRGQQGGISNGNQKGEGWGQQGGPGQNRQGQKGGLPNQARGQKGRSANNVGGRQPQRGNRHNKPKLQSQHPQVGIPPPQNNPQGHIKGSQGNNWSIRSQNFQFSDVERRGSGSNWSNDNLNNDHVGNNFPDNTNFENESPGHFVMKGDNIANQWNDENSNFGGVTGGFDINNGGQDEGIIDSHTGKH